MKKKRKILLLLIPIVAIVAACVKLSVNIYPIASGYYTNGAILFGEYYYASKAIAGTGPNGVGYDSFDVFGFKDNTAVMDPYHVEWQSTSWVYDGINNQELQYFDRNSSEYSFIGVVSDKMPVRNDKVVTVPAIESFQTNDVGNSPKEFLYA